MSLSSSSRMSMVGRKLLAIFYLRQYKKIVEKKLIDRPHASLRVTPAGDTCIVAFIGEICEQKEKKKYAHFITYIDHSTLL